MSTDLVSRRTVTVGLIRAAGAFALIGCPAGPVVDTDPRDTDDTDPGDTDPIDTDVPSWATGGTAALAASYPDPFADDPGGCLTVHELTLGPCYAETLDRRDISEGVDGLPVRLLIRVVDAACAPVPGAVVDIWHCAPNGLYSAEDAPNLCTTGDAAARAGRWFRGLQTTGPDGVASFDSCFPGWYPGRAVHIHFQIRLNGASSATSQLFFEQALVAQVFDEHPVYAPRGQPDRPNPSDGIFNQADPDSVVLRAARQSDGALLAWKTVALA